MNIVNQQVTSRGLWWRKLSMLAARPHRWKMTSVPLKLATHPDHRDPLCTARSGHTVTALGGGASLILGGITMDPHGFGLVLSPVVLVDDTVHPVRQLVRGLDGSAQPPTPFDEWPLQPIPGIGDRSQWFTPVPRLRHTACLIAPMTVLLHGGMDVFVGLVFEDVWTCTVSGDTTTGFEAVWHRVVPHGAEHSPGPRCQHTATVTPDGGRVIIVGGAGVPCFPRVHALDLTTWQWEVIDTSGDVFHIKRLQLHCSAVSRSRNAVVIFGGGTCDTMMDGEVAGEDPPYHNTRMFIYALDLESYRWERQDGRCALPEGGDAEGEGRVIPRVERGASEQLGPKHAVVFGGQESGTGRVSADLLVLDLQQLRWSAPDRVEAPDDQLPECAGACFAGLTAFSGLDHTLRPVTRVLRFRLPTHPLEIPAGAEQ